MIRYLRNGGILAVLLGMVGIAGLWVWYSAGRDAQTFGAGAVTVDGRVEAKRSMERTGGSGTSPNAFNPLKESEYFVTVAYDAAIGTTHRVEKRVSEEFWASVVQGDRVPIRHLPDRPEVIELEAGATGETSTIAGWLGGGALVLGGALGAVLWRNTARGLSLDRNGLRVTGEVTAVRHSGGFSFLQYRFTDGAGVVHTGQSGAEEDHDFSDMPAGTPVEILYDRANPARHALLPLKVSQRP